ncbi:MAG: 6-bladed beta-propeller, partial [Candidatus Aminicenantes bacterium]|nr:6-bladed beta-propeller [Candidatus Aminicenantes bacterium]
MRYRFNQTAWILCICVFFLMDACQKRKASWQGAIEDADGVIAVKNPRVPLYPEMKIVFEEELSIGVEEGDENYMFGREIFLSTDNDGNFYVTDWNKKIVKKYDREGRFLKTIGRPGQGPGEFQNISEVRFDVDGNIYLNDIANRRISILTREGDFLRGIKVPDIFEMVVMNSRGFFIALHTEVLQGDQVRKWEFVYGLFDNEFHLVEEFFKLPEESRIPAKRDENSIAEFFAEALSKMAFQPRVNYVLAKDDSIFFGYPENYEIKMYSPEGKAKKVIQ